MFLVAVVTVTMYNLFQKRISTFVLPPEKSPPPTPQKKIIPKNYLFLKNIIAFNAGWPGITCLLLGKLSKPINGESWDIVPTGQGPSPLEHFFKVGTHL